MNRWMPLANLVLRVAVAQWVALTVGTALLGGLVAGGMGAGTGFLLGLILFPWLALAGSLLAAFLQVRGCGPAPWPEGLGSFPKGRVQTSESREAVRDLAAAILREELGAEVTLQGAEVHALFPPPAWGGWWIRWSRRDEAKVDVSDLEEGSALEIRLGSTSRLLHGLMWVDGGRNLRRLRQFQRALGLRLAALRREREAVLRADSLEGRLAQAELLLLRAQVEPHFLFNTLAHLRELVRSGDAATALGMLDALIAHARATSDRIAKASHSLGREMEAVEGFFALMACRFGRRFAFAVDVPAALRAQEVPVGCLLVPAENALKHGLEPRQGPGRAWVRASREGDRLVLEVADDGRGLDPSADPSRGSGLSNLRARLRLHYGTDASLALEPREGGGLAVRMEFPLSNY